MVGIEQKRVAPEDSRKEAAALPLRDDVNFATRAQARFSLQEGNEI